MWVPGTNKHFETYSLNKDFQMSPKNAGVQITPDSDRSYVSSIPSTTVKQHPHKHFSAHKSFMSWKVPSGSVFFLSQLLIHDLPAPAAALSTVKHRSCEDTTGHRVATSASSRWKTNSCVPSDAVGRCACGNTSECRGIWLPHSRDSEGKTPGSTPVNGIPRPLPFWNVCVVLSVA